MSNFFIHDGRRIQKYKSVIHNGEEVLIITPQWKKYQEDIRNKRLLQDSGINPLTVNYSFSTYVGPDAVGNVDKLIQFVENYKNKFQNHHLYIWGNENSTQKTTMASIVGMKILEQGFKVKFVLMSELTRKLAQQNFEDHEEYIHQCAEADLLIIDDAFDPKKITLYRSGYQLPFLDEFLRARIERESRSCLFTANHPVSSIADSGFGIHLQTLIERNVAQLNFVDPVSFKDDFNPNNIWD